MLPISQTAHIHARGRDIHGLDKDLGGTTPVCDHLPNCALVTLAHPPPILKCCAVMQTSVPACVAVMSERDTVSPYSTVLLELKLKNT